MDFSLRGVFGTATRKPLFSGFGPGPWLCENTTPVVPDTCHGARNRYIRQLPRHLVLDTFSMKSHRGQDSRSQVRFVTLFSRKFTLKRTAFRNSIFREIYKNVVFSRFSAFLVLLQGPRSAPRAPPRAALPCRPSPPRVSPGGLADLATFVSLLVVSLPPPCPPALKITIWASSG